MDVAATQETQPAASAIDFRTDPSQYKHWRMSFDGPVATLTMDVAEDGGIRPGYKLKLNSYDLGVDIELHDALQRIRFEHPEICSVVIASAKNRIFCSGANIYMLVFLRTLGKSISANLQMKHATALKTPAPTPASNSLLHLMAPAPGAGTNSPWPATKSFSSSCCSYTCRKLPSCKRRSTGPPSGDNPKLYARRPML